MLQGLTQCETIYAGKLREAAEMKNDENILIHIKDKDYVAIEVCYHKMCYKKYTRFLSKPDVDQAMDSVFNTAYKLFCKEIIDDRICKNREIFFLTKLVNIFRSYVNKCGDREGEEGSRYKAGNLKKRLQKSHPQLVFHAPGRRNRSMLVFAENLSAGSLAEHLIMSNATIQSNNQSFVTRDMVRNQPTVLVFDNQDYNEETKSGKGQTHIGAGIAVQRQQSQPDKREPEENISKRKRSLTLKEERLPAHHIGKKQSLDVHHLSEYISTDIAEHSRQEEFPRKLDLAYALCKLQSEDNGDNMPSWTGFNTLLHPDVPAMSTISYLPIIDNPITEWSTINEILRQSVKIADELELQQVVLVADEAVYAKIQQVRWKIDLYATRGIVHLGEFQAIMSYSSCIGKRFKNSGLEVIYQA
jgi:hypothetical protein